MKHTLLKTFIIVFISTLLTGCSRTVVYKNATNYDFIVYNEKMEISHEDFPEHILQQIDYFNTATNDIDILQIKRVNGCFDSHIQYKRISLSNNKLTGTDNGKDLIFTADEVTEFLMTFKNVPAKNTCILSLSNQSTLHVRDTYYIKIKGKEVYSLSFDRHLDKIAKAGREELFKYANYINTLKATE